MKAYGVSSVDALQLGEKGNLSEKGRDAGLMCAGKETAYSSIHADEVSKAVEKAGEMARIFDRSLRFRYLKDADIYQVEVIDSGKDEVIRKIPPDEIVRFIEHIGELLGALFDKTL